MAESDIRAMQTAAALQPNQFGSRFGPVGLEVANSLQWLSLDVVSVVCQYIPASPVSLFSPDLAKLFTSAESLPPWSKAVVNSGNDDFNQHVQFWRVFGTDVILRLIGGDINEELIWKFTDQKGKRFTRSERTRYQGDVLRIDADATVPIPDLLPEGPLRQSLAASYAHLVLAFPNAQQRQRPKPSRWAAFIARFVGRKRTH